ncbi:MAG: molybdenum ABC transporter ATP-binding protein [Burkholderiaceae bacterium]
MAVIEARLQLPRPGFLLDVSLALPDRGVSALFGPSGCGKTTVLRALAGLEQAAGRVALGDEVWQDGTRFVPTHRRAIGYVIQEAALFPHLTVQGNLDFGLQRVPAAQRRIALDQVVGLLGIAPLLARRPATLSGGERQRVAIARALATSPRLLLMDEPLAALDAGRKAEVLPYLERLHEELAIPIVYVSHAVDEVARLADRVVLMEAGRVVGEGPVSEVLAGLDMSLPLGDAAGVVLDAVIAERDDTWALARLRIAGSTVSLWARDPGQAVGRRVRVRVLARDVSLARAPQPGTSIGNQLPGVVEAIADDEHPALALVRVRVGGGGGEGAGEGDASVPIVARLSRRSAHLLALAPGLPVWAQVKTVALLE